MPMSECPSNELLTRFLAEELGDPEQTLVECHVDHCETCQANLAELTSGTIGDRLRPRDAVPDELSSTLLLRLGKMSDSSDDMTTLDLAIPGYEILEEIARGGMGVVFRARDVRLNRIVAVKMLLESKFAAAELRLRFRIEGEAVARLQHPGIVQVYECGEAEARPYLVMEYVPGLTLAARLTSGTPFAPRSAAHLVARMADAVAAAHASGVIHRDLKPSNILLAEVGSPGTVDGRDETRDDGDPPTSEFSFLIPKVSDFGLAKLEGTDLTQSGALMGTPSYMAPEQADGRTREIGTATDVYALGAILYQVLTGRPPFDAESAIEILYKVVHHEVPQIRSRVPEVARDLETICHKCLEKDPKRRYRSADALAADLRAFLSDHVIAARPASMFERAWKWGRRNPGSTAAVAATAVILIGIVLGATQMRRALREQEVAAESKRQGDLRASRAESLVQGLAPASTAEIPRLVVELKEYRELVGPMLRNLAENPVASKAGLHARLALLSGEPDRALELAGYIPVCRADELPTLNELLKPYARLITSALWSVLADPNPEAGRVIRAACALAALAPDDHRWTSFAPRVADLVVLEDPLQVAGWAQALEPVRASLMVPLIERYETARDRIRSGKLEESALVTEVMAFDVAASLLARYAVDQPAMLAKLAVTVEARHHTLLRESIEARQSEVVPLLITELTRPSTGGPIAEKLGHALAPQARDPSQGDAAKLDAAFIARAKRRANTAAALFTLGNADLAWPLFQFPKDGDPSARSYLIRRLAAIGADPVVLVRRFAVEPDVSAKRAILIALGDFPVKAIPPETRAPFLERLLSLYLVDPDSGMHGAIDWLLRQKWGMTRDIAAIDDKLTALAKSRIAARNLARRMGAPRPLSLETVAKDWFVNAEGQTYAVVRGPVEFDLGSPENEPDRVTSPPHRAEALHRKRIARTFAIATKEVTVEEFLRSYSNYFDTKPGARKRYSPGPNTPVILVEFYESAIYCNWLSEREGIPRDQWCYDRNKDGRYPAGMLIKANHLTLSGYRLPTEAEWEYSCRAGSVVSRHYGRGEELLTRYEWYPRNSENRAWPVGSLRPNDRGLFDMLGNVTEWIGEIATPYSTDQLDDSASKTSTTIDNDHLLRHRGGAYLDEAVFARSANRNQANPNNRYLVRGFRTARTLP
jgi:serine/threonine protein kinase/formylglycine-generating enzyme required for sulfatase activity